MTISPPLKRTFEQNIKRLQKEIEQHWQARIKALDEIARIDKQIVETQQMISELEAIINN